MVLSDVMFALLHSVIQCCMMLTNVNLSYTSIPTGASASEEERASLSKADHLHPLTDCSASACKVSIIIGAASFSGL